MTHRGRSGAGKDMKGQLVLTEFFWKKVNVAVRRESFCGLSVLPDGLVLHFGAPSVDVETALV